MVAAIRDLDRILRGEATRISTLRTGRIGIPAGSLSLVTIVLCMIYGVCMGTFALFKAGGPSFAQVLASMVKVPALFILTLIVTLPSLYVFNALLGSRLTLVSVIRLLVMSLAVNAAVLASLGPIVAFFSVSTTSYPFMVLFNVMIFAISGCLGLTFLLQTLHRLSTINVQPASEADEPLPLPDPAGGLEPLEDRLMGRETKVVFRIWLIVFGLVGAQMGWVLRPFIGNPDIPFTFFRARESNFFQEVLHLIGQLLVG
ncbi:MAG: hypothetical protein ABS79_06525 [Planctomycetes bacterium SCN 63-9]|nr:MAG: hypothetical protein ABS79_06525 [Planctomycetes bacterium SCN 63-9]